MVSGTRLFIGLFNNFSIFIVLIVLYGGLEKLRFNRPAVKPLLSGLLFGLAACACMLVRLPVAPGVIVDQRNTVIAISGLFGGFIPGIITALMAGSYRFFLGGEGVVSGLSGMLLALGAGLILRRTGKKEKGILFFLPASLFASAFILPGFLLVGDFSQGLALMKRMALPFGAAIFLGICFLGLLLQRESGRVKAEAELKASERQYREIYNSLVDLSYQVDAAGMIVHMSPSVEKITGFTLEEVVGRPMTDFYCLPERRQDFLNEIQKNDFIENFQAQIWKKDGSRIWVSTNSKVLRDSQGRMTGVQGLARDISSLKAAEWEKEQLEDSLRQSQKMEALGTLSGGIAHDYNNILSAILGYADLAMDSLPPDSVFHEYCAGIQIAAERARNLTSQILMYSRKMKIDRQNISIAGIIGEAVRLLKQTLPSTVNFRSRLDPDTGTVFADPTQIHQVVLNIGTNAFHALKEETGEILFTLNAVDIQGEEAAAYPELSPGKYAVLTVCDDGRGMDEQVLAKAFEPFYTTKESGRGTGLGLSVVQGIVSEMNGSIRLESKVGKGTTVRVLLPLVPPGQAGEQDIGDAAHPLRGNERILLVDDEKSLAVLGEKTLSSLGYRVFSTTDPGEALAAFSENPGSFDLVLTDQTMPGITGISLAVRLKAIRPDIPVILSTGNSTVVSETETGSAGIGRVLSKPYSKSQLSRVIRELLDSDSPEVRG